MNDTHSESSHLMIDDEDDHDSSSISRLYQRHQLATSSPANDNVSAGSSSGVTNENIPVADILDNNSNSILQTSYQNIGRGSTTTATSGSGGGGGVGGGVVGGGVVGCGVVGCGANPKLKADHNILFHHQPSGYRTIQMSSNDYHNDEYDNTNDGEEQETQELNITLSSER